MDAIAGEPAHLAWEAAGDPDAPVQLLLLHGLFDSRRTWDRLIPHLVSPGVRIIRLDLLGAGDSARPRLRNLPPHDRYAPDFHLRCIRHAIDELDLDGLVLVGSSYGGSLALRALCTPWPSSPSIRGLVLVDAPAYPQELPPLLARLARVPAGLVRSRLLRRVLIGTGVARTIVENGIGRALHGPPAQDPATQDPAMVERFMAIWRDADAVSAWQQTVRNIVPPDADRMVAAYREMRIPALVLWGRQDRIVSPLYAKRLGADLPDARVQFFDACGHAPHLEKPEQMAQCLHRFFAELEPDA